MKPVLIWVMIAFGVLQGAAWASNDPWARLQQAFSKPVSHKPSPARPVQDPWLKLRAVLLPFSAEEEARATQHPAAASGMVGKIDRRLKPFFPIIKEAADTFDIPEAVIKSVIMAESGGNPDAAARQSSAKGLMQTIDATFKRARTGLLASNIRIKNDPFDPYASIMAGSWYLDQMYKRATRDGKIPSPDRNRIATWRYPLEYYYAGPGNGIKPQNRIHVFSNGTRRIIDKRSYSKKIQTWASLFEVA